METIPGITEISDDTQCKRILAEHGRLEAIYYHTEQPRLFVFWTHKTTFYLAAHYRGFENTNDNGFMVWVADMTIVPKEMIVKLVQRVTGQGRDWTKPDTGWEYHEWAGNAS